jgi:hypothetical protein
MREQQLGEDTMGRRANEEGADEFASTARSTRFLVESRPIEADFIERHGAG